MSRAGVICRARVIAKAGVMTRAGVIIFVPIPHSNKKWVSLILMQSLATVAFQLKMAVDNRI
jgi:hypothetical protein